MRFNGERFVKADGTVMPVIASFRGGKRGRWFFRTETGRILASGMTPADFAQEFWFTTLTEENAS